MIYEVVIGESSSLAQDKWLINASSLLVAVSKAEKQRKRHDEFNNGWVLISAKEIGKLVK